MVSLLIMATEVVINRAMPAGKPAPGRKWRKCFYKEGVTMLVLSRKRGEMITIGNGVTITVLAIQGDRVKIGIEAPAEVPVHRQEICARIEGCSLGLDHAECA
jgi:carbon storage regulator